MSTTEESTTVARTFYEAYNGGDLQGAFDTYISQDLINHTNGGAMNRELWMQSDIAAKAAMPDQTMAILSQAADGDKVFTHWILQGTHTGGTRESAKQQGAEHIPARGIREWIEAHASPGHAVPVATFDTRVVSPRLPGSAAKKAMKRLVALGFRPIVKPETFGVHGYAGPVADGELERAQCWGTELAGLASRS